MARVDYTYVISAFLREKEKEKEWFSPKKEVGDGISREIVVGIYRHDDAVISISFFLSLFSLNLDKSIHRYVFICSSILDTFSILSSLIDVIDFKTVLNICEYVHIQFQSVTQDKIK